MLRSETASTGCRLVCERAWPGKRATEGGFSGQCAKFGEDSQGAQDVKWNQQRFNAGGCDGIGPLFVLYALSSLVVTLLYILYIQNGVKRKHNKQINRTKNSWFCSCVANFNQLFLAHYLGVMLEKL